MKIHINANEYAKFVELITAEHSRLLMTRFAGRQEAYGQQTLNRGKDGKDSSAYFVVNAPLSEDIFTAHLKGTSTIGVFPISSNNTCKFMAFDFDGNKSEEDLRKVKDALRDQRITEAQWLVDFSGKKGYHLYIFFGSWLPSEKVWRFGQIIQKLAGVNIEQFPKQPMIDAAANKYGNFVKLPLGVHRGTNSRCFFLNEQLEPHPIERQFELLRNVQIITAETVGDILSVHEDLINISHKKQGGTGSKGVPQAEKEHGQMHPCYKRLWETPAEQGERNEVCIRLAAYCYYNDITPDEAFNKLAEWNLRNPMPLDDIEISSVIKSEYERGYLYGCQDRILRRFCQRKECTWLKNVSVEDDPVETSFCRLSDGSLAEMLYDPARKPATFFAVYRNGTVTYEDEIIDDWKIIKPYADSQLFRSKTILLPRRLYEYGSEAELIGEIRSFIHSYLTVSALFESIATYYVIFSWLYDRFQVVPYLRALGDYNSGKSRLLQVIGALCYKPIFAAGATTPSPIFRLIEKFSGTLILDEADFRLSDATNELIKILNTGYMDGFPVLRTCKDDDQLEVQAFNVFGPKIIATRMEFQDKATESRCLTCEMTFTPAPHVPYVLSEDFWQKAEALRGKLLMMRLRKYHGTKNDESLRIPDMETRLNQVIQPMLSVISDERVKQEISQFMREYNIKLIEDRKTTLEYHILESLEAAKDKKGILLTDMAFTVNSKEWDSQVTPKKLGHIVRKILQLPTVKTRDGYMVNYDEEKMIRLKRKYGLSCEDVNIVDLSDDVHISPSGCCDPWSGDYSS